MNISIHKLPGLKILITQVATIIFIVSILPINALGQWEDNDVPVEPAISIKMPGKGDYPYFQPITVDFINIDKSDGLASVTMKVTSNPAEHQHVLSARIPVPTNISSIGTRVRLSGKGRAVVEVSAETQSGKLLSATEKKKHKGGLDYSDQSTLSKRLPFNVKFLKGPVRTSKARLVQKDRGARKISAIIYHPMLPGTDQINENTLKNMRIHYREGIFCDIDYGSAMSNDPYIDISFTDQSTAAGVISIEWIDSKGNIYKSSDITIK